MGSEERERPDGSAKASCEELERACDFFTTHPEVIAMFPDIYPYVPEAEEGDVLPYARVALKYPDSWPPFKRAVFGQHSEAAQAEPPRQVLERAGVPYAYALNATQGAGALPPSARAWADGYHGTGGPWLWVIARDEDTRGRIAANLILGAARAMREGRAPSGQIRYIDAYDLCGQSDSADQYGTNSRYNVRQEHAGCALLIVGNLGSERANASAIDTLAALIAHRHRSGLPTVLTSATRCSEWLEPYKRVNRQRAQDMYARIYQGLSGYERDEAKARAQLAAHIVSAP